MTAKEYGLLASLVDFKGLPGDKLKTLIYTELQRANSLISQGLPAVLELSFPMWTQLVEECEREKTGHPTWGQDYIDGMESLILTLRDVELELRVADADAL